MPGTHKSPYTPADLQTREQQNVDKQREEQSIAQFRDCLQMANMSLESDQQASQEQLQHIVEERFTVHVVYLKTLAALCQMPAAMLDDFAYKENLNTEELLESTNGLWLLGKRWLNANNAAVSTRTRAFRYLVPSFGLTYTICVSLATP